MKKKYNVKTTVTTTTTTTSDEPIRVTYNAQSYAGNNQYQQKKMSPLYSVPCIIIMFIVFFPLAIFFLYKRLTFDKTAVLKNAQTTKTFGICLAAIPVLYLLMALTGNVKTANGTILTILDVIPAIILMFIMFGGVGAVMIVQGERAVKNYKSSDHTPPPPANNAYQYGKPNNEAPNEAPAQDKAINDVADKRTSRAVSCKNCGANNVVFAVGTSECEYCGSPLDIDDDN